ncbi:hypothetical protein GCM10007856_03980 [Azospirillum oryzae]|nr:hypothetical protein GCM10007856_03980 [Azospirillum oryzae]
MAVPPRYRLSAPDKDALLIKQAALIKRMAVRIAELEALAGKPKKTSANWHIPPSQDGLGARPARQSDAVKHDHHVPVSSGRSRLISIALSAVSPRSARIARRCSYQPSSVAGSATTTLICRRSARW